MTDLDGDSSMELVLYLENRAGHHLILHREGDIFYGTDRTIRAFNCLQSNGMYTASSSSSWTDWRRMDCQGGAFTEEILGSIRPNEQSGTATENFQCYYIGEKPVDRETFLQWETDNSPGSAYYVPQKQ